MCSLYRVNISHENPKIKIYSLPKIGPKIKVELGVNGDFLDVKKAIKEIKKELTTMNYDWYEK